MFVHKHEYVTYCVSYIMHSLLLNFAIIRKHSNMLLSNYTNKIYSRFTITAKYNDKHQ